MTEVNANDGKLEQFCDISLNEKWDQEDDFFEATIFKHVMENEYNNLPPPFCLKAAPPVPFLTQIIVVPVSSPEEAEDPLRCA